MTEAFQIPRGRPNRAKLLATLKDLEALENRRKYRAFEFFNPYPKQLSFFEASFDKTETLFMAGNQLGKTEAGAYAAACHLTGRYPDWWTGKRWTRPTRGWIAGLTSIAVRDIQQRKLCGEPGVELDFGSGMIPRDAFLEKPSLARGITDAYDTMQIKHVSGGLSIGRFKSYEQGKMKFQGETLDWFWCDEEPDMEIYLECLTRISATKGRGWTTFTPLKGKTELVIRFTDQLSTDRALVNMTIDEVTHIPPDEKARIIASYPDYMRDAKAYGVPMLGTGRIFPYGEDTIKVEPFPIPKHWRLIWGTDIGGSEHPFGAVLCAWDTEADVFYVTNTVRMMGRPVDHATAMKPLGKFVPVAWPHDANIRERGTGESVAALYKSHGLKMLHSHATWPDGSNSTETGITEMQERMTTNRFKVFSHLSDWFEEYRQYHRDNGLIVKIRDDLLSATRIALMMRRFARTKVEFEEQEYGRSLEPGIAKGVEPEHWGIVA